MDERWTEVERRLQAQGLARVSEPLLAAALAGLRLSTRAMDETLLPVGASKIGGQPDLPAAAPWPETRGRPQAFVAQINLADVAAYPCAHDLPPTGLLSFFYATDAALEGDDDGTMDEAEDRAEQIATGCAVLFHAGDLSRLVRRETPAALAAWDRFAACAVTVTPLITLPAPESSAVAGLRLSEGERASYSNVYLGWEGDTYTRGQTPEHRLFGHPYNLEGDARVDSMLAARGQDDGHTADQTEWERAAAEWLLLLQLDSDAQVGMDWNGGGLIYFCLMQTALRARDWGSVWATAQFL